MSVRPGRPWRWSPAALACALVAAGCASNDKGEALALFTVTVAPEVPAVTSLRFEVAGGDFPGA